MKDLLAVIAKGLVDDPDSVSVEADAPNEEGTVVYHIHVAENDMGRIKPPTTGGFFVLSTNKITLFNEN